VLATVCLVLVALAAPLASCGRSAATLPQRIRLALAEGRVGDAVALTSQVRPADRPEVAGIVLGWAEQSAPKAGADAAALGQAYLAIVETLDPLSQPAYSRLLELATEYGLTETARRATDAWTRATAGAAPGSHDSELERTVTLLGQLAAQLSALEAALAQAQAGVADEALRYAQLAGDLVLNRPDLMSLLADEGLVTPVEVDVLTDVSLPKGIDFLDAGHARNGRILMTGHQADGETTAYVVTSKGEVVARILGCGHKSVSLSPSGRYVAYAEETDLGEQCRVYIHDTHASQAGAEDRLLLTALGGVLGTAWAPDESVLVVSTFEGLLAIGLADGSRSALAPAVTGEDIIDWSCEAYPQWLGTGSRVASQHLGWEWLGPVTVSDLSAGTSEVALCLAEGTGEIGLARWACDGLTMAFPSRGADGDWHWGAAVATAGQSTADAKVILSGAVDVGVLCWAPDEMTLLVRIGERLWLCDAETGRLSLLPGEPYNHAAWANDGVIYYLARGGSRLIGIRVR